MNNRIKILTINTCESITWKEVPFFRGAIIANAGLKNNVLFHNHVGDKSYRYSYPLIQYKRINGDATIVCVEDGVNFIGPFLTSGVEQLQIGNRVMSIKQMIISAENVELDVIDHIYSYNLKSWLPLNEENHKKYIQSDGLIPKVELLEKILKGNILSFCKGLQIFLSSEIIVEMVEISDPYVVHNKGVPIWAFDVTFNTNMLLPNNIGLGKNSSIGYGVLSRI